MCDLNSYTVLYILTLISIDENSFLFCFGGGDVDIDDQPLILFHLLMTNHMKFVP